MLTPTSGAHWGVATRLYSHLQKLPDGSAKAQVTERAVDLLINSKHAADSPDVERTLRRNGRYTDFRTLRRENAARFDSRADELRFSVREPWASRTTGATLVHGRIGPGEALEIVSQMPQNGCIFSDGVEADYLPFNSGTVARIGLSDRRVSLVVPHP
jgi:hypothetical protein